MNRSRAWLAQRIAGVLLAAMLAFHFLTMHFLGQEERISYETVLNRISSPWWKAFDLTFLTLILYHGFLGMWGIVFEYVRSKRLLKVCRAVLVASVAGLLITGVYIITL